MLTQWKGCWTNYVTHNGRASYLADEAVFAMQGRLGVCTLESWFRAPDFSWFSSPSLTRTRGFLYHKFILLWWDFLTRSLTAPPAWVQICCVLFCGTTVRKCGWGWGKCQVKVTSMCVFSWINHQGDPGVCGALRKLWSVCLARDSISCLLPSPSAALCPPAPFPAPTPADRVNPVATLVQQKWAPGLLQP